MWITNGGVADVAIVWALTPATGRSAASWSRRTRPASPPTRSSKKLSLRASVTSELVLDRRPPPGGRGAARRRGRLRGPLSCLNEARYGILWGAAGAARACYESALDYAPNASPVRPADRRLPAHPAEARRDDARGQQGVPARPAPRPHEGRRAGSRRTRSASASSTTSAPLSRSPALPRLCSAPTASPLEYPVMRHVEQPRVRLHLRGHRRDPHPGHGGRRSPVSRAFR